jgi:predicted membrane-bound mannosyltransferase
VPSLALARFLTFYTLALIALYSAVSYKTPWCLLSFLHGLILLAGLGAAVLVRGVPTLPAKIAVAGLLAAGLWPLHGESQWFNGRLAADARNPYVYAHSSTDVKNLAAQAERLAAVSPAGHELIIHVVTPENYWPLPWYLRRFNRDHIGYWQDAEAWWRDTRTLPPPAVVILTSDVQESVDERLSGPYNRQMIYGLRPGVLLSVYVQQDLWDAMLASQAARSSP